jgi:hypothetical protein
MNHVIHCSCGEVIVKSGADTKIRSKVLVVRDSRVLAVCKRCDQEVPVPLHLDATMLKSMSTPQDAVTGHVPLYITNVRRR